MSEGEPGRGQEQLFDLPLRPEVEEGPSSPPPSREEAEPAPEDPRPTRPPASPPPAPRSRTRSEEAVEVPASSAFEPPRQQRTTIAPILPRLLAGGADLLVHLGALAVAALGLNLLDHQPRLQDGPPLLALVVAFSFLYTVVSLAFWGQTAGMAWFGLASRQSPQFPLSFNQAAVRWLGGLLTFLLLGLPVLLALRGGSLSDRLSGSQTYRSFNAGP